MDLSPIMPSYKSARVTFRGQHSRKLITIEKKFLIPYSRVSTTFQQHESRNEISSFVPSLHYCARIDV
jgi:hypothetical protein